MLDIWDECINSLRVKPQTKKYHDITGQSIESSHHHHRTNSLGAILMKQGIGFIHVAGGGVRMQKKS